VEVQVPQAELLGPVPEEGELCVQSDAPTLLSRWPVSLHHISLPKGEMQILTNGIAHRSRDCNSLQFSLLSNFCIWLVSVGLFFSSWRKKEKKTKRLLFLL